MRTRCLIDANTFDLWMWRYLQLSVLTRWRKYVDPSRHHRRLFSNTIVKLSDETFLCVDVDLAGKRKEKTLGFCSDSWPSCVRLYDGFYVLDSFLWLFVFLLLGILMKEYILNVSVDWNNRFYRGWLSPHVVCAWTEKLRLNTSQSQQPSEVTLHTSRWQCSAFDI